MKGRSKCLSCGEALRVSDLIPVFSYIFLKGKCRYCKSTYGVQALVVEVLFGIAFLLVYKLIIIGQPSLLMSTLWLSYYTLLFGVMGVMALYDRLHSYIPLPFLVSFLVLCFINFGMRLDGDYSITTLLAPFFVALPFLTIWLLTKGRGLGFGDVIIFFGVGAFFGSLQGFAVLMIAVWVGAIVGLYVKYFLRKTRDTVTAIPFVPFIVLGFLVVLFTGIDVLSIAMLFS